MSSIVSFISDSIIMIVIALVGIVMLVNPYDKIQDAFPKLKSKMAVKLVGAFLTFCGVVYIILLLMGFM